MKLTLTAEQWEETINVYRCGKIVDGLSFVSVHCEDGVNVLIPVTIADNPVRAEACQPAADRLLWNTWGTAWILISTIERAEIYKLMSGPLRVSVFDHGSQEFVIGNYDSEKEALDKLKEIGSILGGATHG